MHTLRILFALGPFVVSILRDQRRWIWFGTPLQRSREFHAKRAHALIARIAKLGPTFVKLAQVFAARADLIPEPYLSQLGTLTDQVPPVPWAEIERELVAAYGEPPERTFTAINHTPIAAASLGQVHRATWRGRDVAVKVLRPNVEHTVERDLRSARAITAWAARRWPVPHVLGFQSLVEEFAARIAEEMDFRLEAEYATEVRSNFRDNPRVVIPEVMHEMTRRRVIVLEFITGTRVDRLPERSVDAQRLAAIVMEVYVQMMLVDGLFHADPHAGNLLLTPDGRLVLLDFGMMVRVPKELRLALIRTVFASIRRDPIAVAEGFTALGLVAPGADPEEIKRLASILVELSSQRTTTQQRLETMLADKVMASLYDFPVILPRDLVYFARTAALIEGIGTRYDPYFNAIQVGSPLVMRMRSRILRSLGQQAEPGVEEIAAMAGWAVGRAWRRVREVVGPLLAVLVLSSTLGAQQDSSLSAAINRAVSEDSLVGATWAVVTPAGSITGAAGVRDVRDGRPMRPELRVQTGSVAKTVTALAILRLVTEGRLSLDAPVREILPQLRIENPWEASAPLRVRHLLDHSAGLDDARLSQVFSLRADPRLPLLESLTGKMAVLQLRYPPGARSSYSNTGYHVAGLVIEAVAGQRYEDFIDAQLLRPLGMTRSTTQFIIQRDDSSLAMGHFDPSTAAESYAMSVRPATQFTTTASDMATLARFLMSDGRVGGSTLVDSSLLRAMARPVGTEAAQAGLSVGFALGLVRRDRYGAVGNCHLGNQGNFRAALCVFPESQSAYFVSFNSDPETGNFGRVDSLLTAAAVGSMLALNPADGAARASTAPFRDWAGWYLVVPNRFEQFAYLDATFGFTRVVVDDSLLHLRPLQGAARSLTPLDSSRLRAPERLEASHVALRTADGRFVIADGLRSLERISPLTLGLRWLSLVAGVAGLLYVLLVGSARSVRAKRQHRWRDEPLRWATLALVAFIVAPLLYLFYPALSIGDPTPANLTMAVVTLLPPLALVHALVASWRTRAVRGGHVGNTIATAAALQWCLVLAAWGLMPLQLWR